MNRPPTKEDRITERFVRSLCSRLAEGKVVRRSLPLGGRVHIDRRLPFLCVYRRPPGGTSASLHSLVRGESAYLIASADGKQQKGLALLVRSIAETMQKVFGAFLVIEIWASEEFESVEGLGEFEPAFGVAVPKGQVLQSTGREMEAALRGIRIKGRSARTELTFGRKPTPLGLPPLVPAREAGHNVFSMGVAVRPVLWNAELERNYPLIRRALHRGLSRALKKSVFEFMRARTSQRLPHYHSLGRRSMVKAVWEVDQQLAEVSTRFDSLLLVTPTNAQSAWRTFQRQRYAKEPRFEYRALPFDSALAKRQLFQIPVERIEDPTLELLFRDQQSTLDRKIGMLVVRGSERFRYASLELYGDVRPELMEAAQGILARIPARSRERSRGDSVDAQAFAARAREELERFRAVHPSLTSRVEIRPDLTGLMVSQGHLLVGSELSVPSNRVEPLIQHEVGTHILTYVNGRAQPFRQLYVGLPGYDELQEGLAVLSEYLVGGLSRPRLRLLAGRVVAVKRMASGAPFLDVFHELVDQHGFARQTAFNITMRVFRSGGFAKDAVYLKGLIALLEYIRQGGRIEPLYVGKLALDHAPIIEELQWRRVLTPAVLRPYYLEDPRSIARLERIRNGLGIHELVAEEPA